VFACESTVMVEVEGGSSKEVMVVGGGGDGGCVA
jgi:hypothetical protein